MPVRATAPEYPSGSARGESPPVGRRRWIGWGACRARSARRRRTLWADFDAWLRRAATVIVGDSAAALNAMNVFPVADSDTGTNVRLTLDGIAAAATESDRNGLDAHGAGRHPVGARQLRRHPGRDVDQRLPRRLERAGRRLAPAGAMVAGTAADGGRRGAAGGGPTGRGHDPHRGRGGGRRGGGPPVARHPDDPLAGGRGGAGAAPTRPWRVRRDQLAVLAEAGVVDAAARRTCCCSTCWSRSSAGRRPSRWPPRRPPAVGRRTTASGRSEYEVMYALRGAAAADPGRASGRNCQRSAIASSRGGPGGGTGARAPGGGRGGHRGGARAAAG